MHVTTDSKLFDMGLCSSFLRFQNSWGFTSFFFCSYTEALSDFINDCCSNLLLVAWKKKKPQWNFLAAFKTAGWIFKGKCFCACWTGERQAGWQGCSPVRGALQQAKVWPCHCILGEFGLFSSALLVKCFPDYRNVSVEQCRAAASVNNS